MVIKKIFLRIRRLIRAIVQFFLFPFGLIISSKQDHKVRQFRESVFPALLETAWSNKQYGRRGGCIIFSMDRAIQLHGLLCGYFEKVTHPVPVYVLYRTSSDAHAAAYNDVFEMFKDHNINPVLQKDKDSFQDQLLFLVRDMDSEKIFFLVDDILFTEDVDMDDFLNAGKPDCIPTLRMGGNLNFAYTVQKKQRLPQFFHNDASGVDQLCWIWKDGEYDWAYPLSVDGHLFNRQEILALSEGIDFSSPNQYEEQLQQALSLFEFRRGICYKKSPIVNIPVNKVQQDNRNIHGDIHQDFLLEKWNAGYQLDYRVLYGFVNQGAHQEMPLHFIKR